MGFLEDPNEKKGLFNLYCVGNILFRFIRTYRQYKKYLFNTKGKQFTIIGEWQFVRLDYTLYFAH